MIFSKPIKKIEWYMLLILTMAIWGTMHPITRSLRHLSQPLIAFIRMSTAGIILLSIMLLNKKRFNFKKKDLKLLIPVAIIGGYIPPLSINFGIKYTSTIIGGLIINTNPIFITLFSFYILKQKIDFRKIIFVLLGFFGIGVTVIQKITNIQNNTLFYLGFISLCIASISVALNTIYSKKLVEKYGGLSIVTFTSLTGSLLLLIHIISSKEILQITTLTGKEFLLAIYIGALPTAVVWFIFFSSLKVFTPDESGIFKLLIPIFAGIYAILLLNETLTLNLIIGGIIVLFSIYNLKKWEHVNNITS